MYSKQLSVRALLLAVFGSVLITSSSMYVALRMSALPWPTVFVAILSMAVIKLLGKGSIQEVNIAQTGMSAGAMVAGGLAFTLPGLWIAGIFEPFDRATQTFAEWMMPKFFPILFVSLAGTIAGTLLCFVMRKKFIEKDKLAFPIGVAASETLKAGDKGGKKSILLFSAMGVSGLFTLLRDSIKISEKNIIPQGLSTGIKSFPIAFAFSPMAVGIGYIIGFVPCVWWIGGAVFSHFLLRSWAVSLGSFSSVEVAATFSLTSAIGLMLGAGVGILVQLVQSRFSSIKKEKNKYSEDCEISSAETNDKLTNVNSIKTEKSENKVLFKNSKAKYFVFLIVACLVFLFSSLAGVPSLASALLLLGLAFASAMSAKITGQTGINPMEIFGILVLLAIRLFVKVEPVSAFFIVAITAVSCGFAGDMLNDYKMGFLLDTDPLAQTIVQLVGAIVGSFVAVIALFAIIASYHGVGGNSGLSAAQAHTVAAMINGIGSIPVFVIAGIIGCIFYLKGIPSMIIGIGMLLPLGMSSAIFLGGFISFLVKKFSKSPEPELNGQVISAGLLGGEGLVGTIVAIVSMAGV